MSLGATISLTASLTLLGAGLVVLGWHAVSTLLAERHKDQP